MGKCAFSKSFILQQDVPCVVCFVATRVAVLMIPGTYLCPQNWTREYHGWLMTQRNDYTKATYECVDAAPEALTGGQPAENGAFFFHVEPRCGLLPCPPYDPQKEMTCAVCTC